MARLAPLSDQEVTPEIQAAFAKLDSVPFSDLPQSARTLARRPRVLDAALELVNRVMLEGEAPADLKLMVAHIASRAHGCMYCSAHTAALSGEAGVPAAKMAAVWEFETSSLFSAGEKAALRLAVAGASVPNAVTDADFDDLLRHFDEGQAVELVAAMSVMGFWNRWNDTVATRLEAGPRRYAEDHLTESGWVIGAHG